MRPEELVRRALVLAFQGLIVAFIAAWFLFGGVPMMAFRWEMEDALTSLEKHRIDTRECDQRGPRTEPEAGIAVCPDMNFNVLKRRIDDELR